MGGEELVITVYRVTGRQLFFRVASSVCEECDLAVSAAKRAANELNADGITVRVDVRPWFDNIFQAIWRGAYHPPAVLVDGKLASQGFVPTVEGLKVAVRAALAQRGSSQRKRAGTGSSVSRSGGMNVCEESVPRMESWGRISS